MNTINNNRSPLLRRFGLPAAAFALALPISIIGMSATAGAETLNTSYSTAHSPVDGVGGVFPVTLSSSTTGTAWSVISGDKQFSTFLAIVKNAGLESMFDGGTTGTFLVPTDQAFLAAGSEVIASLTTPANSADANAFVKSMVSSATPTLLAYFRGTGSVDRTIVTSQVCLPTTYKDGLGNPYFNCASTLSNVPLAASVKTLNTLDGRRVDVTVADVRATFGNGTRLSFGGGFVSNSTGVSNGYVDAIDTVNLVRYAAV